MIQIGITGGIACGKSTVLEQINLIGNAAGMYIIQITNKKGEIAVKQLNLAY
jgi:dephospho-CoA kinase